MGQVKRAVTANGDRIKQLRTALGWKAENLADHSGLNLKTVRTAESGKGVDISSLGLIAEALGVEVGGLISKEQKRATITIVTTYTFENFSDAEGAAFLKMLERGLPSSGEIVIQDVSPGSTVITLEMDEDDIKLLKQLVINYAVYRDYSRTASDTGSPASLVNPPLGLIKPRHPEYDEIVKLIDLFPDMFDPSYANDLSVIQEIREHPGTTD